MALPYPRPPRGPQRGAPRPGPARSRAGAGVPPEEHEQGVRSEVERMAGILCRQRIRRRRARVRNQADQVPQRAGAGQGDSELAVQEEEASHDGGRPGDPANAWNRRHQVVRHLHRRPVVHPEEHGREHAPAPAPPPGGLERPSEGSQVRRAQAAARIRGQGRGGLAGRLQRGEDDRGHTILLGAGPAAAAAAPAGGGDDYDEEEEEAAVQAVDGAVPCAPPSTSSSPTTCCCGASPA